MMFALASWWGCSGQAPDLAEVKQQVRAQFPEVEHLPVETFAQWQADSEKRILLVDAREPAEYEVSHLANALNLKDPLTIRRQFRAGDYSNIVVYCSVGYRSAQVTRQLNEMGLDTAVNLEGSIFEWANQGRPIVDASGKTDKVHPYDARWGALLRPELRADR